MNAKHGLLLLMLALASTAAEAPAPIVVLPDRLTFTTPPAIPDLKTAYIMAAGNVYKLKMQIPGEKPLYTN